MDLDTERLKAFLAVARERSFSRAAERLYRTQPAVSQAIRLLEQQINEPLFIREGRTVILTQAGKLLLEHVEKAFDTLELGLAQLKSLRELQTGEVTIAASDTTACYLLPDILQAYRDQYPGVEVRILNRPSPLAAAEVAARRADIGIVTMPIENPKLTCQPLVDREDVAICAPDHPLAGRKRIKFTELLAYPLLLLDRGSNTRGFIDKQIAQTNITPEIAMELGSIEVVKTLVHLGFGVSIVPRIAVERELKAGLLHAARVFRKAEWRQLGIIFPTTGIIQLPAQALVTVLKERIADQRVV
jgi:DNA-binding transcriptional LysR family regulator